MTNLSETFADVAALIPRFSWEIMDEEQKDDLMAKVVLPRYMDTTADGVQLGPKAWAEMVGATADAIRGRVQRLQASQAGTGDERARAHWTEGSREQRNARAVLRESAPEQIAEMLSDPGIRRKVAEAQVIATRHHEPLRETTSLPLPGPSFIDFVVRINSALIALESEVASWENPDAIPVEFSAASFDDIASKAMRIKDHVNSLRSADNDEFQDIVRNFRVVSNGS